MIWYFLLSSGLLHDRSNSDYDYTHFPQASDARHSFGVTNLHEVPFAQPFGPRGPLLMYLKHMGGWG